MSLLSPSLHYKLKIKLNANDKTKSIKPFFSDFVNIGFLIKWRIKNSYFSIIIFIYIPKQYVNKNYYLKMT